MTFNVRIPVEKILRIWIILIHFISVSVLYEYFAFSYLPLFIRGYVKLGRWRGWGGGGTWSGLFLLISISTSHFNKQITFV